MHKINTECKRKIKPTNIKFLDPQILWYELLQLAIFKKRCTYKLVQQFWNYVSMYGMLNFNWQKQQSSMILSRLQRK